MLPTCDSHICNNYKFAARFIGPFQVLEHIGKLSYCIELSPIFSALYNIFHISKLKLYIPSGGDGTNTNVQLILVNGEDYYEVKKIVAECGCSNH